MKSSNSSPPWHFLHYTLTLLATLVISSYAAADFVAPNDPRLKPARVISINQNGFVQVFIDGYIHTPTVKEVAKELSADSAEFGIVYFNSSGGDLTAAQELGRLIREKGFSTQIGKLTDDQARVGKGICESACPIAFVGGKFRLLDTETGQLGVHRFYLVKQGRWAEDAKVLFTAERDLRRYLKDMGVGDEFYALMMKTPADRIQTIGKRTSYEMKLGTGSEFTAWNWTPDGKLVGLGDTSTGGLAIAFECNKGSPQLTAKFKPWFPPAALLNYDTHSITVNGVMYPVAKAAASFDKDTGFITFRTEITAATAKAFEAAERVGYSLTYENHPGEYARSLSLDGHRDMLMSVLAACPTK